MNTKPDKELNQMMNQGKDKEKNWNPNGYCWFHGFKVTFGHNSSYWKFKKEGHKDAATRVDTMGGLKDNKEWKDE